MTEQGKKIAAGGVFAVIAAAVLYMELSDSGGTPAPPPPPVITTAGASAGTRSAPLSGKRPAAVTAADLDPTLRLGPMLVTESLVYSGTGRNIFAGASAAAGAALPRPIAPARPRQVAQAPVYTGPSGPPPPPPIDLKFFGTATVGSGNRQAFLLRGEDVFLASAGDVVQRRYKVISIAANSIVVEDLVNSNRQTLPLLLN